MVALAPSALLAHSHKKKTLEIVHPWTPEVGEGVADVSVYMTIKNGSGKTERLIRAEGPLAEKIDLVDLRNSAGMQPSSPVAGLEIPPHGKLELSSSGPYVLLHQFKRRLNAYDTFNLILVFEKAGKVPIEVTVEEVETGQRNQHHQH